MNSFYEYGYHIEKNAIEKNLCEFIANEFTLFSKALLHEENVNENSISMWDFGDSQAPSTFSYYSALSTETLLAQLLPKVEEITRKELYPCYSYARIYKNKDILKRHKDRPSCQYSVTLPVYIEENPWDIWFQDSKGEEKSLTLDVGDICVYQGTEREHWRNVNTSKKQIQVFLHYVDKNGPYADFKYDRRKMLGLPILKETKNEEKTWQKVYRIILEMGENIKEECIRCLMVSYIQVKHTVRQAKGYIILKNFLKLCRKKLESGKRKVKYVCCKVREDKTDTSCKCEEKKK